LESPTKWIAEKLKEEIDASEDKQAITDNAYDLRGRICGGFHSSKGGLRCLFVEA
jgi:hypothetical protein